MIDISEKIKILAVKSKMTVSDLAQKSNQSNANLYNKMARNDFKLSELQRLADGLGVGLEVNFVLPTGEKI